MAHAAACRRPQHWTAHLLTAALAGLLAACGLAQAAAPVDLRLIGLNDFHGHLEPDGLSLLLNDPQAAAGGAAALRVPVGGAAALAGLVQALRAQAPNSLFLSSGDLIGAAPLVSSLFRHESTIEVMNSAGLELSAVGNHEFDAGRDELLRLAHGGCAMLRPDESTRSCALGPFAGARFPFLAANVVDGQGATLFAPFVVRRFGGIRVGLIGAVTRSTPGIVIPSGVAGLRFEDEAAAINRSARTLRAQGVKVLIAVVHEGGELGTPAERGDWNDDSCPRATGPIFDIARRLLPEIRVVFSAHTHQGYRCVLDGRVVIQSTSYGRGLSVVDLQLDPQTQEVLPARTRSVNLPVLNERTDPALRERLAAGLPAPYDDALRIARPDPQIASQVAVYATIAAPTAQREVGRIGASFERGRGPDAPAGRLIANAQLAATRGAEHGGAQIAFMNPGGVRSDLICTGAPPCAVTFGQVFSMQPFGNSLVVMSLSGAQIAQLLESQHRSAPGEPSFLHTSEGFSYHWTDDAAAGAHASDLRLDGEPIQPTRLYRVTVNSFMAEGGDGLRLLKAGTQRQGGSQDIDALLQYLAPPAQRSPLPASK